MKLKIFTFFFIFIFIALFLNFRYVVTERTFQKFPKFIREKRIISAKNNDEIFNFFQENFIENKNFAQRDKTIKWLTGEITKNNWTQGSANLSIGCSSVPP